MVQQLRDAEDDAGGEQLKWLRSLRRKALATQGALLHRAGKHAEAVARIKEAMTLSPEGKGEAEEWVWLALAHAATEKRPFKEARGWLDKAREAAPKRDKGLWDAVRMEVLLAEAARAVREDF